MTKTPEKVSVNNKPETGEFEHCVMCGDATNVLISTPIEFRDFYEIGCGQLCFDCAKKRREAVERENALTDLQIMLLFEKNNNK